MEILKVFDLDKADTLAGNLPYGSGVSSRSPGHWLPIKLLLLDEPAV